MAAVDRLSELLIACLRDMESCVVAYSGGVDSAVVAAAAHRALGPRAIAVTGISPSLADGELEQASNVARQIGIRHELIATNEMEREAYRRNGPDRCYHCKTELYTMLEPLRERFQVRFVVNGANADDLSDYRPGQLASREHSIRSPLAECGFSKQAVRELAARWGLAVWDKPATPCLSSRIAYGEEVTPERLRMIDLAEQHLRTLGFGTTRVRYHVGDVARIEVPADQVARLAEPQVARGIIARLRELGFRFVTLDLEGFRSGSLNTLIPADQLVLISRPIV